MVLKRPLREGGAESSALPARESKRSFAFSSFTSSLNIGLSFQEAVSNIEPFLRHLVREEVEQAIHSSPRYSPKSIEPQSAWQLHFDNSLPAELFTASRIESEDNKPIRIVLCDAISKKIIRPGSHSSIKLNIFVLDGDFNPDDKEDWSEQEINSKIVQKREGKRPLVKGDMVVTLKDGVGYLGEISFTDNSSWTRSGKFRLAAKAYKCSTEFRIREAISTPITVKDRRGEPYKKNYPPCLGDEVWRLEKIAKDGVSHRRLALHGVDNVKKLLQLYETDPSLLRKIIGVPNKKWEKMIKHAITCHLDNSELYVYEATGSMKLVFNSVKLVFNSVYKLVGAIPGDQSYWPLDQLDIFQKQLVEGLKCHAYRNLKDLTPISNQSVLNFDLELPIHQVNSFDYLNLTLLNAFPADQDPLEMTMNSDHTIDLLPTRDVQLEDGDQFESSEPEVSRLIQGSLVANNFLGERCAGEYSWMLGDSSDHPVSTNQYHVGASSWQGNGFLATPGYQAVDIVSSALGVHITKNPKARWCKIRAVIKCKILIKHIAECRFLSAVFQE